MFSKYLTEILKLPTYSSCQYVHDILVSFCDADPWEIVNNTVKQSSMTTQLYLKNSSDAYNPL